MKILWIDDDREFAERMISVITEPALEIVIEDNMEDGKKYYEENYQELYGLVLDLKCKENKDDYNEDAAVGHRMLDHFIKKGNKYSRHIPIAILSAATDEFPDAIIQAKTRDEYKFAKIKKFSKDEWEVCWSWIGQESRRADNLNKSIYITILDKYINTNEIRSMYFDIELKKAKENYAPEDFLVFGVIPEKLLGVLPKYSDIPKEAYEDHRKYGSSHYSTFDDKIHFIKQKNQEYSIPFNPVIEISLTMLRLVKNMKASHAEKNNNYSLNANQYQTMSLALNEIILWFDKVCSEKYDEIMRKEGE